MFYDGDQSYRRRLLSPDGDLATFVSLPLPTIREIMGGRQADEEVPRFAVPEAILEDRAFLGIHLVAAALERDGLDALGRGEPRVRCGRNR